MNEIKIFCPATIANVSCGFDVLGLALAAVGDVMTVRKTSQKGIAITKITGQDVPLAAEKNVAGVAGLALLAQSPYDGGFEIEIDKRIKPGSGIGSSAASAAGAVWAINELLGRPFSPLQLVQCAMQGEKLASGTAHADNVAPALYGGFTLVRSYTPLDIVSLPTPAALFATVLHPQIEIKTADARKILKPTLTLAQGIQQWGNVGGLVAGLFKEDYALISRSLHDGVVEPVRSVLIPGFQQLKASALAAGALGCGISGSGPSVFALSQGQATAQTVAEAMRKTYQPLGVAYELHVAAINPQGVQQLNTTS